MKIKIFLVLLFISTLMHAQLDNLVLSKGKTFQFPENLFDVQFMVADGNGGTFVGFQIHNMNGKNIGYRIYHFDKDLAVIDSYYKEEKEVIIKAGYVVNNELVVIEFVKNEERKTFDYNALTSSTDKIDFTSKELFNIPGDNIRNPYGFNSGPVPMWVLKDSDFDYSGLVGTTNNSKYLYFILDLEDGKNEKEVIKVYDTSLNLLNEYVHTPGEPDRDLVFTGMKVADDGSIFYLEKVFSLDLKKENKEDNDEYAYRLYKFSGGKEESVILELGTHFAEELSVFSSDANEIVVSGYYYESKKKGTRGMAFFTIDSGTLTVKQQVFTPMPLEAYTQTYGEKDGKKIFEKNKMGLPPTYKLIKLLGDSNNGYYMIGEDRLVSTNNTSRMTTSGNYFKDIMVSKLNPDGTLDWTRVIIKNQKDEDHLKFSSFYATVVANEVYIFINGGDKIDVHGDGRKQLSYAGNSKNLSVYSIFINKLGDVTYKKLIKRNESNFTYRVTDGLRTNDFSKLLFLGEDNKNKRLLKVDVE